VRHYRNYDRIGGAAQPCRGTSNAAKPHPLRTRRRRSAFYRQCRHGAATVGGWRLAVIDLETGGQPFRLENGTALIANAEIYHYVELRQEMANASFTSKFDCKVALHFYSQDDEGFASRLRGMNAIAIHVPSERRLLLARDPFGIKQLYYTEGSFGFAFASEPQALIASGIVAADVRSEAAMELLQLQFTTGRETIFPGIYRVLPGETLVVESGRIARRLRRLSLPEGPPEEVDEATALDRLEAALMDSVEIHQRSDVPMACFCPTVSLNRPVRLANDTNCFTLSEAADGVGKEIDVVFGVILGTEVGAGW